MRGSRRRDVLVRCALLAATAVCAAVVVVSSRQRSPAALLGEPSSHVDMESVCQKAQAARGTMLQQATMCGSLCDGQAVHDGSLVGTGLAGCAPCGSTVNINLPGSVPYYYAPCIQSSYDPWEWYDYYFQYDPALAPYYEPWTPPEAGDIAIEEDAPAEEEEPAAEEAPEV
jgi:hypothetical protein